MLTLTSCMTNFIFHCTYEKTLSEKTIKAYQIDLNQFASFNKDSSKAITIDLIDKKMLREYIKSISESNKPKTIKRKLATLKAFFNYLEFEDILLINPFRKIRIHIKEGKQLPKTIPLTTITNLFKYVYDHKKNFICNQCYSYKTIIRDIAVLEILFSTGVRVAELCNLTMADVDMLKGSIKITGKGNKERIVPICNSETLEALCEYYNLFQNDIRNVGFFFVNRMKRRLSEQSVRFMIKKHSRAVKSEAKITPHMFRHSIATLLLEMGVDIRYIQIFLGHSMITTTQIYVQVNEEAQRSILIEKHPRRLVMK